MNLMNKLTQWGSLIGVICAIGGGFYAWGEFNTRLANIENRPVADMTSITDDVANLKVDMVDRITAIEDKLEAQSECLIAKSLNKLGLSKICAYISLHIFNAASLESLDLLLLESLCITSM